MLRRKRPDAMLVVSKSPYDAAQRVADLRDAGYAGHLRTAASDDPAQTIEDILRLFDQLPAEGEK